LGDALLGQGLERGGHVDAALGRAGDAQDADASLSGVSGESFVDAVFSDI
jgi:hypothetical protein